MMSDKERLKEIIQIAYKLSWISPNDRGYPLMQLSEVEKCMVAMYDDTYFDRMREWVEDTHSSNQKAKNVDCDTCKWHDARAFRCLIGAGVDCEFEHGIWMDSDTVKNTLKIVAITSWGVHPFAIFEWLGLEEVRETQSYNQKVKS